MTRPHVHRLLIALALVLSSLLIGSNTVIVTAASSSASNGTVFAFGQFFIPGFFGSYPTGAVYLTQSGTPPPEPIPSPNLSPSATTNVKSSLLPLSLIPSSVSSVSSVSSESSSSSLSEDKWGIFPVTDAPVQNFVDLQPLRRTTTSTSSESSTTEFYLAYSATTRGNVASTSDHSALYLVGNGPVATKVLTLPIGEQISFMAVDPLSPDLLYLAGDFTALTTTTAAAAAAAVTNSLAMSPFSFPSFFSSATTTTTTTTTATTLNGVASFNGTGVQSLDNGLPDCSKMTGMLHLPVGTAKDHFSDNNFLFVSCSDKNSAGLYAWNGTNWNTPLVLPGDLQLGVFSIAYENSSSNLWFSAMSLKSNVYFGYLNVLDGTSHLESNTTKASSLALCICPNGPKEIFVGTAREGIKRYQSDVKQWHFEAPYDASKCLVVDGEQIIAAGEAHLDSFIPSISIFRRSLKETTVTAFWEDISFGMYVSSMSNLRYLHEFPVIDSSSNIGSVQTMTVIIVLEALLGLASLVITILVFGSLLWVTIFGFEGSCVQNLSSKIKFLGIVLPSERAKKTNVAILNESIAEQERRTADTLVPKNVNLASRGFLIQNFIGWIFVLLVMILAIIPQQFEMFLIIFLPSGLFPMVCIILGMIPVDFQQRWHQLLVICPLWALSICLHLLIGIVYLGTVIAVLILWAYHYVIYDHWVTVLLLFGLFLLGFLVYEAIMLRSGIRMLRESLKQTYGDDWIRKGLQILSVVTIVWTLVISIGSLLVNGLMTSMIFYVLHSSVVQLIYSVLDGVILKLCLIVTGFVMLIVLIDVLSAVWRIFNVYVMRRSARSSDLSVKITMHSSIVSYALAAFHIFGFLAMFFLQLLYLLLVFVDFLSPARDVDARRLRFMAAYWIAPFVAMNIFHLALAAGNIGMRVLSRKRIEHQRLYEEDIDLFVVDDDEVKHEL